MWLLICLPLDKEKLTVFIVGQLQKYLSGTCYIQSETRAKPELSVEFSHNSMQNGLERRWLGGSEVSGLWSVLGGGSGVEARGKLQETLVQEGLAGDGSVQVGSIRNDTRSPDWVTGNGSRHVHAGESAG